MLFLKSNIIKHKKYFFFSYGKSKVIQVRNSVPMGGKYEFFILEEPDPITVEMEVTPENCDQEDGTITPIASHYKGKRFNSPNDVVVKSDGSVYFTDPPYGLNPTFGTFEEQELAFYGVYRMSPDGDNLSLLIDDSVPNGLAFSPDESLLYVADTEMNHIRVFNINDNGKTTNGRIFAEISGEPLAPDGLKVDSEGNVYVTGRGGIWVLNPEGRRLGIISVPELPANLCWGDSDWKTLYITARTSIYRVRLNIVGIPLL